LGRRWRTGARLTAPASRPNASQTFLKLNGHASSSDANHAAADATPTPGFYRQNDDRT
jgi:hypothetical protein